SGKNIIRWLLKKRTNGSVRYCQYTSYLPVIIPRYVQLSVGGGMEDRQSTRKHMYHSVWIVQ
ncbi:hypothetical protein, partial [Escherichia coli]|uniref:hypothetical protein n=1 Tax=Escherichia coli TaxID=562 RepID=UPI0024DE80E1